MTEGASAGEKPRHTGADWLLQPARADEVFTPEDVNDFHQELDQLVRRFVQREVIPALPAMEAQDFSLAVRLLRQAGELGLTGVEVPEQYGGLGLDRVSAAVVAEGMGAAWSFGLTWAAHTGIGTLPVVYFGTKEQKQRYLPALARAEKIAAYCLTEAGSGSNALGARATARPSADGRYWVLNGTKQWISNGGIADLFVVYAKVDGSKFTAFLVERESPGLSTGREERKLGMHGSSTRSVILEDCHIPIQNMLFEVGKGHHVAFGILNPGRFKLGATTVGAARHLAGLAAQYALQRKQWGKALAEFPLIQQKLAEMAVRIYGARSAAYRTAALLDERLAGLDHDAEDTAQQSVGALQEFVVECCIMKVLGAEALDYVADQAVQIHGGYGYMEDMEVCRAYRDSRINRIFEGTDELNRLQLAAELATRALKGQLPLPASEPQAGHGRSSGQLPATGNGSPARAKHLADATRQTALALLGLGVRVHKLRVPFEQEFLAGVADVLMDLYAMESANLRAEKHPSEARADLALAFAEDAFDRVQATARMLFASLASGEALGAHLASLDRLRPSDPTDRVALKRRIARALLNDVEAARPLAL